VRLGYMHNPTMRSTPRVDAVDAYRPNRQILGGGRLLQVDTFTAKRYSRYICVWSRLLACAV
jgi:hypothetical protein